MDATGATTADLACSNEDVGKMIVVPPIFTSKCEIQKINLYRFFIIALHRLQWRDLYSCHKATQLLHRNQ